MNGLPNLLSAFGLSTAAGLNAYVPLLVLGLLARYTDLIGLQQPFDLLSNPIVLILIAILALLDFIGDKIPAIDHFLHVGGMIIHPIAGAILFMSANSTYGSVSPLLAAICGLIIAGGTHTARASTRPLATATTAGIANPVLSFLEDVTALILSVLSIILPLLAFILVLMFAVLFIILFRRLWHRKKGTS